MSRTTAPRTFHDDFETIERYVAATFARYERVLVERIPTLREPRVADPALALERLRFLVETLGGFAFGAAVGAVAREARRGFGLEVRDRVGLLLARIVRDASTAGAVTELVSPVRFLAGPGRPLLDAFGSQLLARLRRSIPEARKHVSAVHTEIARAVPVRRPELSAALDRLTADDAPALVFSEELTWGWRYYVAAVSHHGLARRSGKQDAEREPWGAWTRRLDGPAAPAAPTQDEVVARGFLLRIA